jgi:hypothetical protein
MARCVCVCGWVQSTWLLAECVWLGAQVAAIFQENILTKYIVSKIETEKPFKIDKHELFRK